MDRVALHADENGGAHGYRAGPVLVLHGAEGVVAERALAYEFRKILVRGGDNADIHALCAVAPEALEFLFLQNAQQFGLEVERKVADFIKKERASVGQFEAADFLIDGSGERAFFMAE